MDGNLDPKIAQGEIGALHSKPYDAVVLLAHASLEQSAILAVW